MRTAHRVALSAGLAAVAGIGIAIGSAREQAVGVVDPAFEAKVGAAIVRDAEGMIAEGGDGAEGAGRRLGIGDRAPSGAAEAGGFASGSTGEGGIGEPGALHALPEEARGAMESRKVEPRVAPPTWPTPPKRLALDPIRTSDDGLAFRVSGHDARGPRDLVLWRLHDGDAAVVARGRSRRDGTLEFPRLVAPQTGLVLVATPAWETPDGPRASPAQIVAGRSPEPRPTAGGGRRGSPKR